MYVHYALQRMSLWRVKAAGGRAGGCMVNGDTVRAIISIGMSKRVRLIIVFHEFLLNLYYPIEQELLCECITFWLKCRNDVSLLRKCVPINWCHRIRLTYVAHASRCNLSPAIILSRRNISLKCASF